MKVLIISYFFPPCNQIASLRTGKWAKYLPEYCIEPWILTYDYDLQDPANSLKVEVDEQRIKRIGFNDKSEKLKSVWNWFKQFTHIRFPDRVLPWAPFAVIAGMQLMREIKFDAILSSHGPPSMHIVAMILSRRYKLPWIADYRDLWTQNHIHVCNIPVIQYFESKLEHAVIKKVTVLTTVSEPWAEKLSEFHNKRTIVIQNGFDDEDFSIDSKEKHPELLRIVYTGGIYPGRRDPSLLFAGMVKMKKLYPELVSKIHVYFIGSDKRLLSDIVERYGMQDHVSFVGRTSYDKSLQWQGEADILLLLESNEEEAKGVYTGKVYEYLGSMRPIMATGYPGGVIDSLLQDTGAGKLMINEDDVVGFIRNCWDKKQRTGSTRFAENECNLTPYTRRHQAGIVAKIIKDIKI
jgi:glycosyltransferase involved in cell wall biosynthesis